LFFKNSPIWRLLSLSLYLPGKSNGKRARKRMNFWLILLIVGLLLTITACGVAAPADQPPVATSAGASSVTAAPATPAPVPLPATPVTQEAVAASTGAAPTEAASIAESVDWLTVEGKTADNLPYRGNPDAPVTLIDYSDFL
jgi:hypothetical protein